MSGWTPVIALAELPAGSVKVLKTATHYVACFHTSEGELLAIDNHCPHEGYPMHQGVVRGCVITCAWHNFKFDLRDGSCLKGDEDVATYPVRIEEGQIEVFLEAIDPRVALPRLYESLDGALLAAKVGQAARDTARILLAGERPEDVVAALLRFDATHSEFGTSHGSAVAIDILGLAQGQDLSGQLLALAQAMDQLSDDHQRRPARPRPAPRAPQGDPEATRASLRRWIEEERVEEAEALLRGSIEAFGASIVAPWLLDPLTDHALSFLHPLIYTTKVVPFLKARDWEDADLVLGALLFRITQSTRHDTLPTWRSLRELLDRAETLPLLASPPQDWSATTLRSQLLDERPRVSLTALLEDALAGVPLVDLVHGVILAASERMLRFDAAIDGDPTVQDGWLDLTHALTGAVAIADLLQEDPQLNLLPLILQAGHFVARTRALDRPEEERCVEGSGEAMSTPEDVVEAMERGDGDGAARAVLGCERREDHREAIGRALLGVPLGDKATRPIVVSHLIKTPLAALKAAERMGDSAEAWLPLAACARWISEVSYERRVRRAVHEAVRFVEHGEIPRILSD